MLGSRYASKHLLFFMNIRPYIYFQWRSALHVTLITVVRRFSFYEYQPIHLFSVTISSPCDSNNGGTAFCQSGVSNAECHLSRQSCQCTKGKTYVAAHQLCQPEIFVLECDVCRSSGGSCYDVENDNSPTGCECSTTVTSSGTDSAGTLVHGCDVGLGNDDFSCTKLHSRRRADIHWRYTLSPWCTFM
jgi:hypothetical protein